MVSWVREGPAKTRTVTVTVPPTLSLSLSGFKLKDFLRDDETLSHFLHHNASLPRHALKHIVEADVNLEKVRSKSHCIKVELHVVIVVQTSHNNPSGQTHTPRVVLLRHTDQKRSHFMIGGPAVT